LNNYYISSDKTRFKGHDQGCNKALRKTDWSSSVSMDPIVEIHFNVFSHAMYSRR